MEADRTPAKHLTMCVSVRYQLGEAEVTVDFVNPRATLPVRRRGGEVISVSWGRRLDQGGKLPLGACARRENILAGVWDRWPKQPVRILLTAFCERDHFGKLRWYQLTRGEWIQGLLARVGAEERVYIVSIEPLHDLEHELHDRWPRILTG